MGVRTYLRERGEAARLEVVFVDVTDTEATLAAAEGAALLWLESPTNPLIGVADLPALTAGGQACGAAVVVDNTFATPLLQRPLELGADAVLHSVTKYLAGHADLLMGAIASRDQRPARRPLPTVATSTAAFRAPWRRSWPCAACAPSLYASSVRSRAAVLLAERLAGHPAVERVRYPGLPGDPGHERASSQMAGFGAMLAFEVAGGADAADRVCAAARVITHATSLGGVETLMERRARWAGDADMPPSLIRLSVGIEHVEDLWADLEQALAAI